MGYVRANRSTSSEGWLRVQKKFSLPNKTQRRAVPVAPDWAMYHPHVSIGRTKKPNAIYVAAEGSLRHPTRRVGEFFRNIRTNFV